MRISDWSSDVCSSDLITGFVGDFTRTTSVARLYRAVRVGGTPASMGWESQAVHLVPKDQLYRFLNRETDHGPVPANGAGEPPPPPNPANKTSQTGGGGAGPCDFKNAEKKTLSPF